MGGLARLPGALAGPAKWAELSSGLSGQLDVLQGPCSVVSRQQAGQPGREEVTASRRRLSWPPMPADCCAALICSIRLSQQSTALFHAPVSSSNIPSFVSFGSSAVPPLMPARRVPCGARHFRVRLCFPHVIERWFLWFCTPAGLSGRHRMAATSWEARRRRWRAGARRAAACSTSMQASVAWQGWPSGDRSSDVPFGSLPPCSTAL